MTKQIRIENADTSTPKVEVQIWDKGVDGAPDRLAETLPLSMPTQMVTAYVHGSRYLVVRELP